MLTEECHLNRRAWRARASRWSTPTSASASSSSDTSRRATSSCRPSTGSARRSASSSTARSAPRRALSDPKQLTEAARQHLREKFLAGQAGLTGVNFAVAETGGFVVCTNEGNADLGVSLPPLHIACMGVEKLIPARGGPRGLPPAAGPQRHRPAHHHVHLALPRAAARRRAAHRAGGQRAERPPGQRDPPARPVLHPLRGLHEHLPGVPAERRPQLRDDGAGAHRLGALAGGGCGAQRRAAVRLQPLRLLQRRLPGEDRPPQPAPRLAARAQRPWPHPGRASAAGCGSPAGCSSGPVCTGWPGGWCASSGGCCPRGCCA